MSKANVKTSHSAPIQNNTLGILYMVIHVIALAVLYAAVKELTKELSSNLIVFLYKATIVICILPWCFYQGISQMKTNRIGLHMIRGFLSIMGQLCMFYAIKHIGLSDVTAVQFLEHVIVLLIGILYFKEKATKTKFAAIIISFLGALIIVRPDLFDLKLISNSEFNGFNSYFAFVFLALMFYALNNTVIKVLGKTEKTKVQLFYVTLFATILSFPTAFMKWHAVAHIGPVELSYPYAMAELGELHLTPYHFQMVLLLAFCYFMHAIFHFKAYKHAEISVVIPFEYSRLIFAGILGYCFFEEAPTYYKLYGYIMIIGAGLYLLYAERKRVKRAKQKRELADEFAQ